MNRRHRSLAPITDSAWSAIDDEAARTLRSLLAARRLVDFDGPKGWDAAAVPTGRRQPLPLPVEGVRAATRTVRPMVELRADAVLSRDDLERVDRGGADPDLAPLVDAARRLARAEDGLVFQGDQAAGIDGIVTASPHDPIALTDDYSTFPRQVARAVATLRSAAVDGPYGVALGPRCYAGVMEATEHGGYPVIEHLRLMTGGPVVWAPAVDGTVVLSLRGGDFELHVGDDLGVGYASHDESTVTVVVDESLTFSNHTPEAAIHLRYD